MVKKENIVFGIHPVKEALRSGMAIDRILIQQELKSRIMETIRPLLSETTPIPVLKVPKDALEKVSKENHQGVIAWLSPLSFQPLEKTILSILDQKKDPVVLMLDHITDVKNMGAILRSAEALGVDLVVIPTRGGARINQETIRSSSGAALHIPISRYPNLIDAVDLLSAMGFSILSATEKGMPLHNDLIKDCPVVLVMGSEEKGITRSILKRSNQRIRIPLSGKTASLNVSVATGILLYEIQKQRS